MATTYYVSGTGLSTNNGTSPASPLRELHQAHTKMTSGANDVCLASNGTYQPLSITKNNVTFQAVAGQSPVVVGSASANTIAISNPLSNIVIDGFEITGAVGLNGVDFAGTTNLTITRCYIHDNTRQGIGGNGFNVVITRNRIRHNGVGALEHGMYITGQGYTIANNIIENNSGYGIQVAMRDPSQVGNNNNFACFQGVIANNTIAYEQTRCGIVMDTPTVLALCNDIQILNNLFYCHAQSNATSVNGIEFNSNMAIGTVFKNNISFGTRAGSTAFIYTPDGQNNGRYVLTANNPNLQTDNGTQPNMVNAPFATTTSPDFHPAALSNMVGSGLNLTASGPNYYLDYAGTTRQTSGSWDVGAYKAAGAAPTAPAPPTGVTVT